MSRYLYLTITFLLVVPFGFSQKTSLERITQEDGLPGNMVKAIAMDRDGFIWAGTDDGLVKIEGANFISVVEQKDFFDMYKDLVISKKFGLVASTDSGIITINQVYNGIQTNYLKNSFKLSNFQPYKYSKNIFESTDSSLWVSFPGQLVRIKNQEVNVFNFPGKNHTFNFFRSFQVIDAGSNHIYILSQTGYLYALDADKGEIAEISWSNAGTEIFSVCKIDDQRFLIGSGKGLMQMNLENGLIKNILDLGFNYSVSTIAQKDKNHFILGTWSNGAYEFSLGLGKPKFSLLQGSEDQEVYDILLDNQNQVWLATSTGLFFYRNMVFNYPFEDISHGNIKNITPGPDGLMYFTRGDLVYCADNQQRVQKYFQSMHGEITSLAVNRESILIGTIKGYVVCEKFKGETSILDFTSSGKEIYSLAIDKNADIWLLQAHPDGTKLLKINNKGEILNLSPKKPPIGNFNLNAIKTSPKGEVYIAAGGINHYLYKYNYENGILENISIPIKELGSKLLWVYDFSIINNQTLLLATQDGVYQYQNNSMKHYDLGFQTNKVALAVASDNVGRVWISTHNGILCYDSGITTLYNEADGLLNKFVNRSCLYIDSKNTLWVGTRDGMALSNIPDEMKTSAQPIISSLKNSGVLIQLAEENSFLQHKLLNFTFASPDYPAKYILYQYSLTRDNEADYWKDLEKKKDDLIFDALNKGNYTLKVRAKTKGHYTWSNPVNYKFTINKIWYARPEIILSINCLLILLVFLYLRYSRKKSLKEKERLEKIISLRTMDLMEQNKRLIKTQQQLIQSEKMATVGLLAAGIAHEINNPVNYINGGILVLRKSFAKFKRYFNAYKEIFNKSDINTPDYLQLPDEQQIEKLIESSEEMFMTIEEGIDKTTKIVQSIRVFSSNSENVFTEIDINAMLDHILKLLSGNYKDRIEIVKDYAPQSKIIGVSVNIQQIFVNLLTNAIQAIPEKGIIWIKTRQNEEQNSLNISIKDDGIGIDQRIKEKIFDPFFSTKDVGKGTGLGLYLTYRYIEQHHGKIKVISEPGKGTEFIISLPISNH